MSIEIIDEYDADLLLMLAKEHQAFIFNIHV